MQPVPSPPRRARGVVIAWMPVSQRSATIADRLGYELLLIGRSGFRRAWTAPLAYPLSAVRTLVFLVRRRPRAAIIAAPPFVATIVALPVLAALRAPFAIDVHSGALLDRRWRWSVGILARLARRAVAAIVTLPSLEAAIGASGARTMVIPDPLPRIVASGAASGGAAADTRIDGRPLVVAVCGWGDDEPIEALVASAKNRPWRLVLTGRPRREVDAPANVTLAGFLDDDAYVDLLAAADVVVVLTERDQTLLSGAWEAIALARPLVLSGTPALRSTFADGVRYVDADAGAIAAGIDAVLADPEATAKVQALRERFGRENDAALASLAAALGSAGGTTLGG